MGNVYNYTFFFRTLYFISRLLSIEFNIFERSKKIIKNDKLFFTSLILNIFPLTFFNDEFHLVKYGCVEFTIYDYCYRYYYLGKLIRLVFILNSCHSNMFFLYNNGAKESNIWFRGSRVDSINIVSNWTIFVLAIQFLSSHLVISDFFGCLL